MPTQIPRTVLDQMLQTNSSPEIIVALLNEAELTHTRRRKDLPAKKQYPCWSICPVCGEIFWKPPAWRKRTKMSTCSRQCNGVLRGQEWAKHAYKGRAAWTAESKASYHEKMSGANNPAWKGGVTYFKTHGNYVGVKYVRCPAEYASMARKDGYVMEHRLLVAQAIGRPLLRSEAVHHIDHDPTNNDLGNLQLFESNKHHKLYEHHGLPLPLWQL